MNDPDEAAGGETSLRPRVALLSILGFWLFYFAIVSIRSMVLDLGNPWDLVGRRIIVTVVSAGVTLLLYLVLRRIPRRSLAVSVAAAALLSVPAAILYSTVNWLAFRAVERREYSAVQRQTKTVVIEATRSDSATPPAPPTPPSTPAPSAPPAPAAPKRRISVHLEDAEGHRSEPVVTVQDGGGDRAGAARDAASTAGDAAMAQRDAALAARDAMLARIGSGQDDLGAAIEAKVRSRLEAAARKVAMREADAAMKEAAAEAALAAARVPLPPVALDANRRIMVQVGGGDESHGMSPVAAIADNAANGYFFIAAWAALYLALCYAAETRVAERRAARFRAAAQAAEIRALRYQVNPHFLFNTLNSLSSLVMIGKAEAAERMILNLSTFFRTSLTGDPTEDMTLDDEIRLQRLYLDIEAVRFPERLVVSIDVPPALGDVCVPGLILQPLVENAVKYGVSRARRPVTIRIAAREENNTMRLTVEDDGEPLPDEEAGRGTGVGLRNVRDRIAARFGEAGNCLWGSRPAGGFVVTLTLPIVRRGC